jgi:DNA repair exonuclease SbcCD nuclease subunit
MAYKLAFIGDVHISEKRPRSRKGDWLKLQQDKLEILKTISNKVDNLICAGDLFHSVRNSNLFLAWVIKHLPFMDVVPGNHDLPGNNINYLNKSPLAVMEEAKSIKLLMTPKMVGSHIKLVPWVWGEPVPKIDREFGGVNIVVAHYPVYPLAPPPYHEKALSAHKMREKFSDADLIVASDIHQPHVLRDAKPYFINTGPLMRHSYTEKDIDPRVWIVKIDGNKIEISDTIIDSQKNSFTDEFVGAEHEVNVRIDYFIQKFDQKIDVTLNYDQVLDNYMAKNGASEDVRNLVDDIKQSVGE